MGDLLQGSWIRMGELLQESVAEWVTCCKNQYGSRMGDMLQNSLVE
jgi:hypothetical protein